MSGEPRVMGLRTMPFFFQAEDGIRDYKVTGVQTCALPISLWLEAYPAGSLAKPAPGWRGGHARSEERRVGKERRSRWSPDHLKKKKSAKLNTELSHAKPGGSPTGFSHPSEN